MGYPPWYGSASAALAMRFAGGGMAGGFAADDMSDLVDWDGDIEALHTTAASASVGGGGDGGVSRVGGEAGLGMTAARQAEFQAALFHMLAQVRVVW